MAEDDVKNSQAERKSAILKRVNAFLSKYEGYEFNHWISLGNAGTFKNRLNSAEIHVHVDPEKCAQMESVAFYLPDDDSFLDVYDEDLFLSDEPSAAGVLSETLWHEMIHAISHGLEQQSRELPGPDHRFIGWAESAISGLVNLTLLERVAAQEGRNAASLDAYEKGRRQWEKFVARCHSTSYPEHGLPSDSEREEFKKKIGFDVDWKKIKARYLQAGYHPAYFDKGQLPLTFSEGATLIVNLDNCKYWVRNAPENAVIFGYYLTKSGDRVDYTSLPILNYDSTVPAAGLVATSSGTGYHIYTAMKSEGRWIGFGEANRTAMTPDPSGTRAVAELFLIVNRMNDTESKILHRISCQGGYFGYTPAPDFSSYTVHYAEVPGGPVKELILK